MIRGTILCSCKITECIANHLITLYPVEFCLSYLIRRQGEDILNYNSVDCGEVPITSLKVRLQSYYRGQSIFKDPPSHIHNISTWHTSIDT